MVGSRRGTPNDPTRQARILDATLDVVATQGVHGTTHRKIAAQAKVALGSLTYYFDGIDDILCHAFAWFAENMSRTYRTTLAEADTLDEAEAAVVELICGPAYASHRDMSLIFEMYAYANHNPNVARHTRTWVERSRESLELHFPPATCRALDALIEGWPMHRAFERAPLDRALVAATVHAVVTALGHRAPGAGKQEREQLNAKTPVFT